ncbi:MAG TPA: glycoside hydrolase family 15 protein [Capsulimonadaceae bacterium]|nr:glycoside hydrolase family 15 protein [Capsulimonadaceae bacterium]
MPRDIPVGNGNLLVDFDSNYELRDFYFPYVGKENQAAGHPFHFGIWVDGRLTWIFDSTWQRRLDYQEDTLVTQIELVNDNLELTLRCRDAVDFHENIYCREIVVENRAGRDREIRLFFHQDFHIYETEIGDTAYYDPDECALIHYKDERYFLCNVARDDGRYGWDQFATGAKEVPGMEGTWRDAEDGLLSGNPIAQGSVDSVGGITLQIRAGETQSLYYYICAAGAFNELMTLQSVAKDKRIPHLIQRTKNYWHLWVNKMEYDYNDLPQELVAEFKKSLLILRTQINNNGAIIAATDSDIIRFGRDTYCYLWPRDGALTAISLDLCGYQEVSGRFFEFCQRVLTKEGYFLHNYNPDGSAGSSWHPWFKDGHAQLPIQEDETALVVLALWIHFDKYRQVETLKPLYRDLVVRAADFMMAYTDPKTGLPQPSYDLWEERRGILAFTIGTVWAGLNAAANFADVFGETETADRYRAGAARMKEGTEKYLWLEDKQRFARMINFAPGSDKPEIDYNIDSAMYALFAFGMYDANDPKIVATMECIKDRLWVKTDIGGIARYENDYYHQVSQDIGNVPGNPWFMCTLWLAQWYIARAKKEAELEPAVEIMQWVQKHALCSGVLSEQVNPYTGAPLSVSPLTWSHAEYCRTVIAYMDRKAMLSVDPKTQLPTYTKMRNKLMFEHSQHHSVEGAADKTHPSVMAMVKGE